MSENDKPTAETFLNDIKDHQIKILHDDGIYRHIRYGKSHTGDMSFNLITWPGHLAYTGDMGSFMFRRVEDMFTFFRRDELKINPQYWSEKVFAQSIFGEGIKAFSVDRFHECVLNDTRIHLDLDEDAKIPADIQKELEPLMNTEDEHECVQTIRDFESDKITFYDFWEHDLEDYTYHFIWCLYAIVWGIIKYDEIKVE